MCKFTGTIKSNPLLLKSKHVLKHIQVLEPFSCNPEIQTHLPNGFLLTLRTKVAHQVRDERLLTNFWNVDEIFKV